MLSSFSISHVTLGTRKEARHQLAVILLISFLPLIVGFVALATNATHLLGVWNAFEIVFFYGQLYFYAMATCGHILFLACFTTEKRVREMRLWSVVFVSFCIAFMALYIGQGETTSIVLHFHGALSVLLLLVAVVINYRVIVLSQHPPPLPEEVHRDSVQAMAERVEGTYD